VGANSAASDQSSATKTAATTAAGAAVVSTRVAGVHPLVASRGTPRETARVEVTLSQSSVTMAAVAASDWTAWLHTLSSLVASRSQ